jgi:hypothetical protein
MKCFTTGSADTSTVRTTYSVIIFMISVDRALMMIAIGEIKSSVESPTAQR